MSGVIDTNLLLYAANRDCEEHQRARAFLTGRGSSAGMWYLTEGIVYEFLRVATHIRVFPQPLKAGEALEFLESLLQLPNFGFLEARQGHWKQLRQIIESLHAPAGNLFFDVRTVALMREHGVRVIYTADADFKQFDGIEVLNPLTDSFLSR